MRATFSAHESDGFNGAATRTSRIVRRRVPRAHRQRRLQRGRDAYVADRQSPKNCRQKLTAVLQRGRDAYVADRGMTGARLRPVLSGFNGAATRTSRIADSSLRAIA